MYQHLALNCFYGSFHHKRWKQMSAGNGWGIFIHLDYAQISSVRLIRCMGALIACSSLSLPQLHPRFTSSATWELSGLALPRWWRLEPQHCASLVKSVIDVLVLHSLCHHTDVATPRAPPPACRKKQSIFSLLDACDQIKIRNLFPFQSLFSTFTK